MSDDPLRGIDFSERIKPLMQEMILLDQKRMEEIERLRGEVRYWRGAHERQSLKAGRFKAERDRARAENARLRELYENVVGNRERFGWTINHLLECEEALRVAEEQRGSK